MKPSTAFALFLVSSAFVAVTGDESTDLLREQVRLIARNVRLGVNCESPLDCSVSRYARSRSGSFLKFSQHMRERRALVAQASRGPSVHVSNRVYLGNDNGKACGTAAVEQVEAKVGDDIIYCFKVTNDGYTTLKDVKVFNDALGYDDQMVGLLAPGQSYGFTYGTSIMPTANPTLQTNTVRVSANPVSTDGTDLPVPDVSYSDTSTIAIKSPYSPPGMVQPNNCLQDSWLDNKPNGEELVCSTKIASFAADTLKTEPMSCVAGETIRVHMNSVVTVFKDVYDLGWFMAADGGDALTGSCSVNALRSENQYTGLNSFGLLSFEEEQYLGHENDQCGEVIMQGEDGFGYEFEVPLGMLTLKCADEDDNGTADISVCFTWRTDQTDELCTVADSDPATVGRLPDLYPGAALGSCYCNTYEVPTITVTKEKACL
jgi:hypothetical protein